MKTSIASRHNLYDTPERHSERLWEIDALRDLPAAPATAAGAALGAPVAFRTMIISRYRPAQERMLDM